MSSLPSLPIDGTAYGLSQLAANARNLDGFACPVELRSYVSAMGHTFAETPIAYVSYGVRKAYAMQARAAGDIATAIDAERTCERHYARIPAAWQW